jgi:uncharacterized membrane protein
MGIPVDRYPYYDPGYYSYPPPVQKQTNGLAIASLVCSLVGIVVSIAPIIGAILGFIALQQIKKEPHRYEGKGMAMAGMIIGIVLVSLRTLFFIFYFMMIFYMVGTPFWF